MAAAGGLALGRPRAARGRGAGLRPGPPSRRGRLVPRIPSGRSFFRARGRVQRAVDERGRGRAASTTRASWRRHPEPRADRPEPLGGHAGMAPVEPGVLGRVLLRPEAGWTTCRGCSRSSRGSAQHGPGEIREVFVPGARDRVRRRRAAPAVLAPRPGLPAGPPEAAARPGGPVRLAHPPGHAGPHLPEALAAARRGAQVRRRCRGAPSPSWSGPRAPWASLDGLRGRLLHGEVPDRPQRRRGARWCGPASPTRSSRSSRRGGSASTRPISPRRPARRAASRPSSSWAPARTAGTPGSVSWTRSRSGGSTPAATPSFAW